MYHFNAAGRPLGDVDDPFGEAAEAKKAERGGLRVHKNGPDAEPMLKEKTRVNSTIGLSTRNKKPHVKLRPYGEKSARASLYESNAGKVPFYDAARRDT